MGQALCSRNPSHSGAQAADCCLPLLMMAFPMEKAALSLRNPASVFQGQDTSLQINSEIVLYIDIYIALLMV